MYRNTITLATVSGCFAVGLLASSTLGQCPSSSQSNNLVSMSERGADIVDTAIAAGSFKTLTAALQAADLVSALKGDGPFTVFAPTDEAFAKLPTGTVEALLKPENKAHLQSILLYHVVPGNAMAAQVVTQNNWKTLNGQRITIAPKSGRVMVDKAGIVKTDIDATNGTIHVIDTVMLPQSKSIVGVADGAGVFKTLIAAATAAGLADTLMNDGPYTVFAPTDDAFAKLPKGTVESLLKPENKHKLIDILKYHIVPGRVFAGEALAAQTAATAEGSRVRITASNGQLMINNARILTNDVQASNGLIHIIDQVLLPE